MGSRRNLPVLISSLLAVLAGFLLQGCNDSANDEVEGGGPGRSPASFQISPSAAVVDEDTQVIILSVVGGESPFAWTVSDASLGNVTPTTSITRDVNYRPATTTRV